MSFPNIYEVFSIDPISKTLTPPQILLTTRNFSKIGSIKYDNWNFSFAGAAMHEITFDVYKPIEITEDMDETTVLRLTHEHIIWDNLVDMRLLEIPDCGRFEISVNYTDDTKTVKSVHGYSLECELSELKLYDFHVNDDEAMSNMEITEYNKDSFDEDGNFIPTTFCNFSDEKHSLLHRVIADKAPHWRVGNQDLGTGYITPFISLSEEENAELSKEFQRTFTEDGISIYEFLTGTVANECNVVFVFDTMTRTINCYSLCDCILQHSGEVIAKSIGEDTNVFISKNKLANKISITSKKENVKNYFRIIGGDDIITSMVAVANVTGSNYLTMFSDVQYQDMSDGLVNKLKDYQELLKNSQEEYEKIYLDLCKAYDERYYLESGKMPAVTLTTTTAQEQYEIMLSHMTDADFSVAVQTDYSSNSFVGVTNNVLAMAKILVNSKYEVSVIGTPNYTPLEDENFVGVWSGKLKLTSTTNETDCYPIITDSVETISIYITKDEITFAEQKLEKALQKGDMLNIKFELDDSYYLHADGTINVDNVTDYFEQYCLNKLVSFYNGYESCISILAEMGQKTDGTEEKKFYDKYLTIRNIVNKIKEKRQKEVDKKIQLITELNQQRINFQNSLNMEEYLGEYYLEFCSYRREDEYTNNNYISDGLSDAECLEKAKELIAVAQKEISKACVLQRTLSSDLNNLFMLEEFEPLWDKFALFNYVRLETDDDILKLRLIGIEIDGSSLSNINVTFSEQIESVDGQINDIKNILEQAKDVGSSFPSTVRQAKKGKEAKEEVDNLYTRGLNAAKVLLSNNDNNEVTFGGFGMLCKNQGDSGDYGLKQLRLIGNGLYLTDDAWEHVKMAVGQIEYNGEEKYGIIADTIIGNMIVGEQLKIGNESGSVEITGDGINITNGTISWNKDGSSGVNPPIISMDDLEGIVEFTDAINKSIEDIRNQIDGEITSWFEEYDPTPDNEPASLWTTDEKKAQHEGDLFYNISTGVAYRYVYNSLIESYEWSMIADTAITEALKNASKAQDTADSKRRVFYTTPVPPYDKGDLWVQGSNGDILHCMTDKINGESYSESDWVKSSKYTDDTALIDFIEGEYSETLKELNQSIRNSKARSWYQEEDPSESWDNTENHIGDLWYCCDESQKTYIYTENGWQETNVPKTVFDTIDGKRQIFVSKPNSSYRTGDLWIISEEDCIAGYNVIEDITYNANTTLVAKLPDGLEERASYIATDWFDISTHEGMQALDNSVHALELLADIASDSKITPSEKQQLKLLMDNITSDKNSIVSQCEIYSIDSSEYVNKYNALYDCVYNSVLNKMDITVDVPDDYSQAFTEYYEEKESIEALISFAIKQNSDDIVEELDAVKTYLNQVDGRIQTHCQSTPPSDNWTDEEKEKNDGDIWINSETGGTYQWNYELSKWEVITNTEYLESISKLQVQIFTALPTNLYHIGDLLIPNEEFTFDGMIYHKKFYYVAVTDSELDEDGISCVFKNNDWTGLDYTNDDSLTEFIDNTFIPFKDQVDGKAEIWCQSDDPSDSWTNKAEHEGDIWYDTTVNKTYVYVDGNWEESNVPQSVLDMIDGKRQVFVTQPTDTDVYSTGDLWVLDSDTTINGTLYKTDTILVANVVDGERTGYNESDWIPITTHDGLMALDNSVQALNALNDIGNDETITPTEKQQIKLMMQNITSEYNDILKQCSKYSIVTTDFTTDYDNLKTLVDSITSDLTTTVSPIPSGYPTLFTEYYSAKELIISEIEDATKEYSENTLAGFVDGEYSTTIDNIRGEIDGKARSWYQDTDPSLTWDTEENHEGDLWYNSSTDSQNTYIYSNGAWKQTSVPKELFDTIDGIASIYVTMPSNPVTGDLLIPSSNIGNYKTGKVYRYNGSTWGEINYTDDTKANAAYTLAENAKKLGDDLSTNLGMDFSTQINGKYIISPVIAGGYLLIGDKTGTYAQITTDGTLSCKNANIDGIITAENGAIGGWTIDSNVLYAINDNTYTILRRNGNVAIAVGAPSLSSTTGANVRIFHNGTFNLGYNGNGTGDVNDYNFYATSSGNVYLKGTLNASTIKSSTIQGAFDSSGNPKFSIDANGNITGASLSSSTGGNFNIDDQGLITGANLSIENEISTEAINCTTINNKAYPKTLTSNATIYVNATSGDDDNECVTDAVFQTLQGAINSIPKFMNGRTVTIELQTNVTENILISSHVSGRISINLNGKTIYGYVRSNAHAYTTISGSGTIHPSTGVAVGSYTASVYVERGAVCQISSVKIHPSDNLATDTSYKACVVSNQSQIYASGITIMNSPYVGFMANIMGRIHVVSSRGLASNYGHMSASGGYISLGNSKQTGGKNSNTTESGGGTVKYHSATFDTATSSSSSTASTTKVTKTATYTSSKGNAIQYYGGSSAKWRSDNTPKVGDWGYGDHVAFWFFGDDFESMANKNVTKIVITFTRNSGGNSSAVTHRFYAHSYESQPKTTDPTYYSTTIGSASVATGSTGTITITNSSLINNIKARKGICSIPPSQTSSYYSVMSGTMKVKFYYTE